MRQIDLKEHREYEYRLSTKERDLLLNEADRLGISIQPVIGEPDRYTVRAGSIVGSMEIDGLSVLIEPKMGIPQLLSLACYAMSRFKPQRELFDYQDELALPDVLALALASAARRAFARGILHGYRFEEEALYTVRGRIRFDEQIRRRFGVAPPVEVRRDEFTDDILANQLVKAAARRLMASELRWPTSRAGLGWVEGVLDNVSAPVFAPAAVPDLRFDRLNQHYREVISLSRIILRHTAIEAGRGMSRASGFLMNMNLVFQEFVTQALREALQTSFLFFRERIISSLDVGGEVSLRPDLTWWDQSGCKFVGDVKYKNLTGSDVPQSDLYQLLAYVSAANLPGGLLVYAQGEVSEKVYCVRHANKRLEVAQLDLSGNLEDVLSRVDRLADRVDALCVAAEV